MTKKLIAALSIAGVLALGGGTFAICSAINKPVATDEEFLPKPDEGLLTELKIGRYYLEGGTQDEYLEVYDDGTLQIFGFDYFKLLCEAYPEYIATMSDEEFQKYKESEQDLVDFWNGRNYYKLRELGKFISLTDNLLPKPGENVFNSGYCLSYTDENTLEWDDNHIYKFAE